MLVSKERLCEIKAYYDIYGFVATCEHFSISTETLARYLRYYKEKNGFISDKKEGVFHWREWAKHLIIRQELHEKASWSQDVACVELRVPYRYVILKPMADYHIGSIGTDYETFLHVTDLFIQTPYLYGCLIGDETDNFVSFKNQLAVLQQILNPEEQDEFIASWLEEIAPKLLFATWGNHGNFTERVAGINPLKNILNRNLIYFNGIGVCNLKLNNQEYKIVATHKAPSHSTVNLTHGLKQLARKEIPDADIYIEGHYHVPDIEVSFERGKNQIFMVLGTLKTNDGFIKRNYSYFTSSKDGALAFDTQNHRILVFASLEDALEFGQIVNT